MNTSNITNYKPKEILLELIGVSVGKHYSVGTGKEF